MAARANSARFNWTLSLVVVIVLVVAVTAIGLVSESTTFSVSLESFESESPILAIVLVLGDATLERLVCSDSSATTVSVTLD